MNKKALLFFIIIATGLVILGCLNTTNEAEENEANNNVSEKSGTPSSGAFHTPEQSKIPAPQSVKVPVLMYHHLVTREKMENNPELKNNGSIISAETFREQMLYLKENGFTAITLKELEKYQKCSSEAPEKPIIITFDDGYESNYRLAYPVLKNYGLKAVINIVVDSSEKRKKHQLPHLTWSQMQKMLAEGLIDIESHTYDMHKYCQIDVKGNKGPAAVSHLWLNEKGRRETEEEYLDRIEQDLKLSKEIIEKNLKKEVRTLSFPYGAYNEKLVEIAEGIGYSYFLIIEEGYIKTNEDFKFIPRFGISEKTPKSNFIEIVEGKWEP